MLNGKNDEIKTPELNGQGAYAKAWIREKDGLYLHKRSSDDSDLESHIEVCVSNILDKCNVNHVRYLDGENNNKYTCKCRCMTTDRLSILPGMDYISYMNIIKQDPQRGMMKIDADNIYKMCIVDYLISNRDRHGMNWGMFYDAETMEILGCHPLFDHNNAFDEDLMEDKDAPYLFNQTLTMRKAAEIAIKHVDFHFTDTLTQDDFMTKKQYTNFMEKASELGIEVDRNNSLDHILNEVREICREYRAPNNTEWPKSLDEQFKIAKRESPAQKIADIIRINKNNAQNIRNVILTESPEMYTDITGVMRDKNPANLEREI